MFFFVKKEDFCLEYRIVQIILINRGIEKGEIAFARI